MKNIIYKTILSLLAAASILGCSVKTESNTDKGSPFAPQNIPGPNVEGSWASDCKYVFFDEHQKIFIKFTGENFERIDKRYTDSECTKAISEKISRGVFYFIENENNEYYTIEYKEDLGNGWSQLTNEKIYKDHQQNFLYISNFRIGYDVKKENMLMMKPM